MIFYLDSSKERAYIYVMNTTKITFDFGKQQLAIEGAEQALLDIIKALKELAPKFQEIRIVGASAVNSQVSVVKPSTEGKSTLRDFVRALPLSSISEKIAGIAYYAIKIEGRQSFSSREMGDWFGLCGFQKPSVMSVAFSDAKRKYRFIDSKGRDQWTVTTDGENKILEKLEQNRGG
jgi:hypothetical protein